MTENIFLCVCVSQLATSEKSQNFAMKLQSNRFF